MPNLDPATVAQKWANNLGAATTAIKNGVTAVTTAPTQMAAAAVGKWQAAVQTQKAANDFVNALSKVSLAQWQQAMLQKGLNRIGPGAQAAIPKFTTFLQQFLPFEQNIAQQVRSMPSITLNDRIARMVAMATQLATFQRQ